MGGDYWLSLVGGYKTQTGESNIGNYVRFTGGKVTMHSLYIIYMRTGNGQDRGHWG